MSARFADLNAKDHCAMTASKQEWIEIGSIDDIPVQAARIVKSSKGCIAVFRTATGSAYALQDRCPHMGGPLSQGIVHGTSVTCPLHNWVIDLRSGKAMGADEGSVPVIPLKIEAGRVFLDKATVSSL
jgi:nitrite reductase (NADH) small subunit